MHYKYTSPFSGVGFPICTHLLLELWVSQLYIYAHSSLHLHVEKTTKVTYRHRGVHPFCCTLHCHCHSWVQAACDANREDAVPGLGKGHGLSGATCQPGFDCCCLHSKVSFLPVTNFHPFFFPSMTPPFFQKSLCNSVVIVEPD